MISGLQSRRIVSKSSNSHCYHRIGNKFHQASWRHMQENLLADERPLTGIDCFGSVVEIIAQEH
jgi:hypothetical protein